MTKEEAIRILNLKEDYNLDICEYQYRQYPKIKVTNLT